MIIDELQIPQALIVKPKRRRKGFYAREPKRKGSGLWLKSAFDLVIAKKRCMYAREYKIENDRKIEGHVQEKTVKICNGCLFLTRNGGYECDK